MIPIKSISDIVRRWREVTPTREAQYRAGIINPLKSWKVGASAGASVWNTEARRMETAAKFEHGVKKAGTEKWREKALELGVQRWGPGVIFGRPAYETGFAPFRDMLFGLSIPKRYGRGDPRNIERVKTVAAALHQKKLDLIKPS